MKISHAETNRLRRVASLCELLDRELVSFQRGRVYPRVVEILEKARDEAREELDRMLRGEE